MADDPLGAARGRGDRIDVERRGIRGEDRSGLAHAVQLGEDLLLQLHALEHRFHDDVDLGKTVVAERRADQLQALGHELPGEAAALDRARVVFPDRGQAALERRGIGLLQDDRDAGVAVDHRDAGPHRARAHDGRLAHLKDRRVLGDIGDLGDFALSEE